MTIRRRIRADALDATVLYEAVDTLRHGGIVAYPTDTFYGLAVIPTDGRGLERLFDAKGREARAAIPLVAASLEQADEFVGELTPLARRLADAFWPGPLTLVIAARRGLDPRLLAGGETVAVRVPAHGVAIALAQAAASPITSTSANRSGQPPAQTADEVEASLGETIDLILDGGACAGGAPSTIVEVTGDSPRLVREGAIAWSRVVQSLAG